VPEATAKLAELVKYASENRPCEDNCVGDVMHRTHKSMSQGKQLVAHAAAQQQQQQPWLS